jgi:ubiquinone biosynthesis UbiH/UbiF/VisC/COQ6 family hydroxylase
MPFDIVIVGAGPAGLAFALSLAGSGLRIALVERQSAAALADPAFDGREIALTHRSERLLRDLGAWRHLPPADIAPLREARVLNGASPAALTFRPGGRAGARPGVPVLGHLVPNHLIRRALFQAVAALPGIELLDGVTVTATQAGPRGATVTLGDGRVLDTRLVVAADTRFSETRRRAGIAARMRDFGKVMLVCRMAHTVPHRQIATEWFDLGQTVAMLPLNGNTASAVLTLPAAEIDTLMALDAPAFGAAMTRRLRGRWGAMTLASTRHAYPLVAVYADRFVGKRLALIGDAAVGMHPVTAHGFNLGLRGAHALAEALRDAAACRQDIADPALLRRWELGHRRVTRPLYLATNATALLYTDSRLPARVLRDAGLRLASRLPGFRSAVAARLTDAGGGGGLATSAP